MMHNIKHYITVVLIMICISVIYGQYDEKQVLTQQAFQLLAQRQFGQAETLFQQVLAKYPDDLNSILQLLNIYYQTSQIDKAEAILDNHRRSIPQITLLEHEIQLLIIKGMPDAAWQKSMVLLSISNHDQNRYRVLASYFERRGFFEQVLALYQNGRTHYNSHDLFMLEIANAALSYRLYDRALAEYLRFLDTNPNNLFFVNNQCKLILAEAPEMLSVISNYAIDSTNPIIKELYAGALVSMKRYDEALLIYKQLPPDKLYLFSEQQFQTLNDEIAYSSFGYLSQTASDILRKSDYRIRMAQIAIRNQWLSVADSLLDSVINDSLLVLNPYRYRTANNVLSRRLKADLILESGNPPDSALMFLNSARSFARHATEAQEIDVDIARLYIATGNPTQAKTVLFSIKDAKLEEQKQYYMFMNELLLGDTALADSLMNEFIIKWPGSKYVNDAMYMMMFILGLKDEQKTAFQRAYMAMLLRDKQAPVMLQSIYAESLDEELLILAIEWAISLGNEDYALTLLQHEWQDPLAKEYAPFIVLMLMNDPESVSRHAREFLKQNPNSIFSPSFRSRLSASYSERPSF